MSLLLGIDLGTSYIKVSVVDSVTGSCLCTVQYPEKETEIICEKPGWAEQDPRTWWYNVCAAVKLANSSGKFTPADIAAVGIAYQMHGLVLVDKNKQVLRRAIIWCDSRATDRTRYPFGNFTAGKLAWVKNNEAEIYKKTNKILLPGDYISMKLTGELTTTPSALSEGMFWNMEENTLNESVFSFHGFNDSLIAEIRPVFSTHGLLKEDVARELQLRPGIPVSYKAGDQMNNALSLNVMEPGEVAATAGTSGVIYVVSDKPLPDAEIRVNTFAHVNQEKGPQRMGILLCINGCGSAYQWIKRNFAPDLSYDQMNEAAAKISTGSEGLQFFPFGNGAERMLGNQLIEASFSGIDFNRHEKAHIIRAAQEGIAYAFRYGLDILRSGITRPRIIRAARSNLFLSELFARTFASVTNISIELFNTNSASGAAIGAGIGAGLLKRESAFEHLQPVARIIPHHYQEHNERYELWKQSLTSRL